MRVTVNGEDREVEDALTIARLVTLLNVDPSALGVAVAVDGEVVPKSAWGETTVRSGARVEVLSARGGG